MDSPVEIFDAGHAPEVAWRHAGAEAAGDAPARGEDEDEDGIRTRMACGDTLVDDVPYAEGDAMFCPRHGDTSAITEKQWLAEHPPEPVGFLDGAR